MVQPEKAPSPKKKSKKVKPRHLSIKAEDKPKRKYTIRYGLVPHNQLSDSVIVANPCYGTPIGKWGSRPVTPNTRQKKMKGKFYEKLEKSILKQGFKNPIFCNCYEEGTFSRYGTSRLWLAKKHKLEIPCIIADYTGEWSHLEELKTEEDILAKFQDKPDLLEISNEGMRFDGCSHCHL